MNKKLKPLKQAIYADRKNRKIKTIKQAFEDYERAIMPIWVRVWRRIKHV